MLLLWGAPAPGSMDDLFVVLSAGRSLREGTGGALFAGGEAAWGATSTLDLLLKALAGSFRDPFRVVWWLNTGLFALAAGILFCWARGLSSTSELSSGGESQAQAGFGAWGWFLTALALVAAPGFSEGGAYLLETCLWALFMGLAGLGWTRGFSPRVMGAVLFCLAWCRPEGAFMALMLGIMRPRLLIAVLLAMGLEASWRFFAAGHVLSDTFFAKSSDSRLQEIGDGIAYLRGFLLTPQGAGTLVGILLPWWGRSGDTASARALSALGVCAVGIVVLSGGDGYLGPRLMLPVSLLGIAAAGSLLRSPYGAQRWGACAALLLVLVPGVCRAAGTAVDLVRAAASGSLTVALTSDHFDVEEEVAAAMARASRALSGAAVGVRDMQSLRWFEPSVPVRDASGLTDRAVSRSPAPQRVRHGRDAFEFLSRAGVPLLHLDHLRVRPRPWAGMDVLQLLTSETEEFIGFPRAAAEAELLAADYVAASIELSSGWLNVLVRRDLAEDLLGAGFVLQQL